jgi:hypothetical protein
MTTLAATPEEPVVFTYAFTSKANRRVKRIITEIIPGIYQVETVTKKPRITRVPGGIVLMMMNEDFTNKGLRIETRDGSSLTTYSFYQTGLETLKQGEQILIGLDDKGKVVTELIPSDFLS